MAKFCLIPKQVQEFKLALKDGRLNPEKLSTLTSAERRAVLEKVVGKDNAVQVNSLFESKLLLKNQQAGYISWAKKVSGISPEAKRDLISRIERMDKILNPADEKAFLEDLASTRLGFGVSEIEAKTISDLSMKVTETSQKFDIDSIRTMTPEQSRAWLKIPENNMKRMEYGRSVIALDNYMTNLRQLAKKQSISEIIRNPRTLSKKVITTPMDISKSMSASGDNSALLNQGLAVLTNPRSTMIWVRNARTSWKNLVRTFGGKPVWDEFRADLVSRPNYINGFYKEIKVALNVTEEAYPTSLPEKVRVNIPIGNKKIDVFPAGRAYKAGEVAYNIFQFKNRADLADMYLALAERSGKVLKETADLKGLGSFINSLTSRGGLGRLEPVGDVVNAPFFSLRRQVALADSLTGYQLGEKSLFVRKQAGIATAGMVVSIASVLSIAEALRPGSVEKDPTSADFGTIKINDTRFDITGGRKTYITLAERLRTGKIKSSSTGEVTELNSGKYGSKTKQDVLEDFTQNKLSPFLGQAIVVMNNRDRSGNEPTITSVSKGLFTPLGIQNMGEVLANPNSAPFFATLITNFVGLNNNTYPSSNIKGQIIPEGAKVKEDDIFSVVQVYTKAFKTDPEVTANRLFTGQKIMQVSDGGIIVVKRQSVAESQAFKEKYGAKSKEVILDHTIPNKLGGEEKSSNWKLVPTSVWSSYTPVENALIKAVKEDKIELKEAQKIIVKFKKIEDTSDRKEYGLKIINKYK